MNHLINITVVIPNLLIKKNWEIKLFHSLLSASHLKINIINTHEENKFFQNISTINFLLLKILNLAENKFQKVKLLKEKIEVIRLLNNFSFQDVNKNNTLNFLLKKNNSNIVLNLTTKKIESDKFVNFPRYGICILGFMKDDNSYIINQFLNFSNNINIFEQEILIDYENNFTSSFKVNFNRFKCFYQTKEYASLKMCNIFLSELNKLPLTNSIKFKKIKNNKKNLTSQSHKNLLFSVSLSKYFIATYSKILINKLFLNLNLIDQKKNSKWHLAFVDSDNYNIDLSKIIIQKSKKNEYWADPFLFKYSNSNYVFFENYKFNDNKGVISVGKIVEDEIVEIRDIINCEYHMSYPFVYEYQGKIFMIPETHQSKRLEIWVAENFPYKWKLYKTAFLGHKLVDSSIIQYRGDYWLFTNMEDDYYNDFTTSLSIFKVDSPLLNSIEPHKLNPVVVGTESSRNAGSIFVNNNGKLIRPSQAYTGQIYGRYINLSEIIELDINNYRETIVNTIKPDNKNKIIGVHHINKSDDMYVLDVFIKK